MAPRPWATAIQNALDADVSVSGIAWDPKDDLVAVISDTKLFCSFMEVKEMELVYKALRQRGFRYDRVRTEDRRLLIRIRRDSGFRKGEPLVLPKVEQYR